MSKEIVVLALLGGIVALIAAGMHQVSEGFLLLFIVLPFIFTGTLRFQKDSWPCTTQEALWWNMSRSLDGDSCRFGIRAILCSSPCRRTQCAMFLAALPQESSCFWFGVAVLWAADVSFFCSYFDRIDVVNQLDRKKVSMRALWLSWAHVSSSIGAFDDQTFRSPVSFIKNKFFAISYFGFLGTTRRLFLIRLRTKSTSFALCTRCTKCTFQSSARLTRLWRLRCKRRATRLIQASLSSAFELQSASSLFELFIWIVLFSLNFFFKGSSFFFFALVFVIGPLEASHSWFC